MWTGRQKEYEAEINDWAKNKSDWIRKVWTVSSEYKRSKHTNCQKNHHPRTQKSTASVQATKSIAQIYLFANLRLNLLSDNSATYSGRHKNNPPPVQPATQRTTINSNEVLATIRIIYDTFKT